MVTLITEKLQNQSLDDLARKTYDAGPCSAEKLNNRGTLFPFELNVDKSPWKVVTGAQPGRSQGAQGPTFPFPSGPFSSPHTMGLQWRPESPSPSAGPSSDVSLGEHAGQPLAPPTKRHCRSLSEPDELARCRSPWRPGGSKVWTPVSKRRCNSGGSATLQRFSGHGSAGLPRASVMSGPCRPTASSPPCAAPRPASASSRFADSSEGGAAGPCELSSRRRLSLSQEHLVDAGGALPSASSTPTATPEPSRRQGLLRSRSQPCVLDEKKSRRKRRRDEDARGARPALDFLKMTRTLKNSKSLCSLDYEDDGEDDAQVKTVVSSPCDTHDPMSVVTPGSSPRREHPGPCPAGLRPWTPRERVAAAGDSEGTSAEEEGVFPLDCEDLDLEQIENN